MAISTAVGNDFRLGGRSALNLLLAGLALGCISNEQSAQPSPRSIIADVFVSVDNRTLNPVVIYVGAGAMTDSLGVVSGRAVKSFSVPSVVGRSATAAQLEARSLEGAPSMRSASFSLLSGHQIIWTLDRGGNGTVTMR